MLALLSLLDLVYMLRSTLAATLLKIIALPVPLLRQVPLEWLKPRKNLRFSLMEPLGAFLGIAGAL